MDMGNLMAVYTSYFAFVCLSIVGNSSHLPLNLLQDLCMRWEMKSSSTLGFVGRGVCLFFSPWELHSP